jgi:hypothetical protein
VLVAGEGSQEDLGTCHPVVAKRRERARKGGGRGRPWKRRAPWREGRWPPRRGGRHGNQGGDGEQRGGGELQHQRECMKEMRGAVVGRCQGEGGDSDGVGGRVR